MDFFESLKLNSDSASQLEKFLHNNILSLSDFYYAPYLQLKQKSELVYLFVQEKRRILGSLDLEVSYCRTFLLMLLDLSCRFNFISSVYILNRILKKNDIKCNNRIRASLLYIDPKPTTNDDYINCFDSLCECLQTAIDEEDDDPQKAIATFINYCAIVIHDTNKGYYEQLVVKIKDAIASNSYPFLKNIPLADIIYLHTSNIDNAYIVLETKVDEYLTASYRKSHEVNNEKDYIIESDTEYANQLSTIEPDFEKIRQLSVERHTGHENLGRGVDVLTTSEQLYEYMHRFGNMHIAKMRDALKILPIGFCQSYINLYDWGCGQGIASMAFLERFESQNINKIILIDPSEVALSRAALHCNLYRPGINMKTINRDLDHLTIEDFDKTDIHCNVHLFSNILDIDNYDSSQLLYLLEQSFSGVNYFICTSPYIDDIKSERLNVFTEYFKNNYESFSLLYKNDTMKNENSKFWCCNNTFNHHQCSNHKIYNSVCNNRWTKITRVFKVDLV